MFEGGGGIWGARLGKKTDSCGRVSGLALVD